VFGAKGATQFEPAGNAPGFEQFIIEALKARATLYPAHESRFQPLTQRKINFSWSNAPGSK
jgi:hypothetical protein